MNAKQAKKKQKNKKVDAMRVRWKEKMDGCREMGCDIYSGRGMADTDRSTLQLLCTQCRGPIETADSKQRLSKRGEANLLERIGAQARSRGPRFETAQPNGKWSESECAPAAASRSETHTCELLSRECTATHKLKTAEPAEPAAFENQRSRGSQNPARQSWLAVALSTWP